MPFSQINNLADAEAPTEPAASTLDQGRWCVVSTVRAPQLMTDLFIEHYLKMGASEIHIFFDDPLCTEINPKYLDHACVFVYVCDESFLKQRKLPFLIHKENELSLEQRQFCNYAQIQSSTCCPWLLIVDVDELIYSETQISEFLTTIPENIYSVLARPFEAIYNYIPNDNQIFQTYLFKSLYGDFSETVQNIYSDPDLHTLKDGFWAHKDGKPFIRTTEMIGRFGCHDPLPLNSHLATKFTSPLIGLLHFEGMSMSMFIDKRLRRINRQTVVNLLGSHETVRLEKFKDVYEKHGISGAEEMYKQMHVLSNERLELAQSSGFVVEKKYDHYRFSSPHIGIKTFHDQIMVYSPENHSVFAVAADQSSDFLPIYIQYELHPSAISAHQKNRCFLYIINQGVKMYVFVDPNHSYFRVYDKPQAQLFNIIFQQDYFHIENDRKYLNAGKNGMIIFNRSKPLEWERFYFYNAT